MASAAETALERLRGVEKPARLVVEGILVISLAILVARIGWLIVSPAGSVGHHIDRPLPSPMQGQSSTLALATDRTILVRANPFEQGEAEEIIADAPETNLNLNLDGLRMSTEGGQAGNAIIRTPDGIGKNYSVGDEILAGVTLERILSDRVIINRDGATETLMLGGRGEGLAVIGDGSQTTTTLEPRSDSAPESVSSSEDLPKDGTVEDPDVLFAAISAAPYQEGGRLIGYQLNPRGTDEVMRQAGLRSGDVLLQVNGTPVANLDMSALINRIGDRQIAELTVQRDGSRRTVRLRFDE